MAKDLCSFNVLLTTGLGKEDIAASFAEEEKNVESVMPRPLGFKGLVLVRCSEPKTCLASLLRENVFIEKGFVVNKCVEAAIDKITEASLNIARNVIGEHNTFAIRTVRRGKHDFSSIDINVHVGREVQLATGARVDLENPDYTILINILGPVAFISIVENMPTRPKRWKEKTPFHRFFNRLIVMQEPYLSHDLEACFKMGERIGRALQTYEVGDYYIALTKPVNSHQLGEFIRGVTEGIESRYSIQVKSYSRKPVKTKVHVYELHLLVRSFRDNPIIIFEPEGEYVAKVSDKLARIIQRGKRPVLVFGAREGVPTGLFRFAELVVDIAPGMTLSTEQALTAAFGALIVILGEEGEEQA